MDRREWEKKLTCFQAHSRGYLVRKEVQRAREDFEDIVSEIEGKLTHLKWRETVIPLPHFTDADGPFIPGSSSTRESSRPRLDVCGNPPERELSSERRGHRVLPEWTDAERDDPQTKTQPSPLRACVPSCDVTGDAEERNKNSAVDKDGRMLESTGDSTTVWSSLELDINFGPPAEGSRQFCLAQEVPRNPEALRLHRNTLTMELLWLQQAIDSRKKYLSLKNRLSVS